MRSVDINVNKGFALDDSGKYNEAIKSYDKALEINPKNEEAQVNKGNVLGELRKYNESIKGMGGGLPSVLTSGRDVTQIIGKRREKIQE